MVCGVVVLSATGCQNTKTRATEGAVIGGLLGATLGGIVGHQNRHDGEGVLIGAATGILTGTVVGSQIEKQGQTTNTTTVAANQNNPGQMTTMQILELSRQGVNEDVIVDKIRLTNSRFNLTNDDVAYLKQQGVSQKVIDAMQGK